MTRETAIACSVGQFTSGAFKAMLARRIAIPTESQNPERSGDLLRYLTDEMIPDFQSMGFATEIIANPKDKGPFLLAERIEDAKALTVLGYGHGDVIRGMAVPAVILGTVGLAFLLLAIVDYTTRKRTAA
jgi:hypothetical protein